MYGPKPTNQNELNEQKTKILASVMSFLYLVQLSLFYYGACRRYHSMKHVGKYSLNIVRPYSYKLKHFTIGCLGLVIIAHTIFICIKNDIFDVTSGDLWLLILQVVEKSLQIFALCIASLMFLFEYRRALGHIWYVHFLFFLTGAIYYGIDVLLLSLNVEKVQKSVKPYLILFCGLECLISLTLAILTRVFPSDFPYERRNYINVDDRERALQNFNESGSLGDRTRRTDSIRLNQRDSLVQNPAKSSAPMISARVTSQISIDQKNRGQVLFQLITKSNGQIQAKVKRTYTNFRSIDE